MPFRVFSQGVAGLLAAVTAPALIAFVVTLLFTLPHPDFRPALGMALAVFFVAFLHAFVLGLPAFVLGYLYRKITAATCIAFGFLVGALPLSCGVIGIAISNGSPSELPSILGVLFFFGGAGAIGGAACWAVLKRTLIPELSAL